MKQRSVLLALSLFCFLTASAEEPVQFRDPVLKAAVEDALWVSDPTPSDMLGMTLLNAEVLGVADLTGLEHAENLLELRLGDNQQISDLSPLAGLSNLRVLAAYQNRISDLTPLAGLVNLTDLDIHHNQVRDVSALAGLTRLRRLKLRENPLRDISPLSALTGLEELILSVTAVSDISPLLGLRSLKKLDLRGCPLDPTMRDVHVAQITANNPGIYFLYESGLYHAVVISSSEGGRVIDPGEGAFPFEHGRTTMLTASADPGFIFLNWSGSYSGTENPAALTVLKDYEIRASFFDPSRALFVDDTAVHDPVPGDPRVSDSLENGTPEHPFDMIQEAVVVASEGMSIFVRTGTYHENIDLLGKSIRLVGIGLEDPNGDAYPIITGAGAGPIVSCTSGEDRTCTVMGFVLTRGTGGPASAVYCHGSSPTIANCLIVGNRSGGPNGAAVYCRNSRALLTNCTIADNVAGRDGAAICLVDSDVVLTNSIVWRNWPGEILPAGESQPLITWTDVAGGWPGTGNVDEDPLFAAAGRWADPHDPGAALAPGDPSAVWVEGDYHLKSRAGRHSLVTAGWYRDTVTSPCIDAGDPNSPLADEPLPNGGIVNLGAYGATHQAGKSPLYP